jgi:mitogen-activated protein kinase 7
MGAGAYGVVMYVSITSISATVILFTLAPPHSSAADEISGETVAIKLVTRVFEKAQLAKRALRELTLLRHFTHENITGLIDVDAITPDFDEMSVPSFYHANSSRRPFHAAISSWR